MLTRDDFITMTRRLVPILAILACVGCGNSPKATRSTGGVFITVTYEGKPVTEGHVSLESPASGTGGGADLDENGVATLPKVDEGSYVVTVIPPVVGIAPPEPGQKSAAPKQYANIPDKVRNTATTPLKVDVKPGMNELKLELKQ